MKGTHISICLYLIQEIQVGLSIPFISLLEEEKVKTIAFDALYNNIVHIEFLNPFHMPPQSTTVSKARVYTLQTTSQA